MKRTFTLAVLAASVWSAVAQKTVYIPNEWKNPWPADSLLYAEDDPDGRYTWSKSRSVESDNVIVFWDKGYGTRKASQSPSAYQVDEQDLLAKCEAFYDLEINKLGFVDAEKSNLSRYKVMVLLNHTTDWVCYGGGYDYMVSALWLGPSACKPVGHSVAHEVGHSFHYMCYAEHSGHRESDTDNTGFHLACGNGQAIWEQTAQWQANQSYPELMYSQSIGVFRNSHNLAFSHEWHRYQSYWFHYYLCQYYNDITTVAQVWNQPMTGQTRGRANDFNQALMKLKGLKAADLYRLYYDYAARLATWDLDVCAPYRNAYIGDFHYAAVLTDDRTYQVAFESAPQSTGFNIIPLIVPETGTEIKTTFTSLLPSNSTPLADGDPALYLNGSTQWEKSNRTTYFTTGAPGYKGFRLGYVALLKDGTRRYLHRDTVYCQGANNNTAELVTTIPEGTERLWMIVSPAPSKYYQHLWDEKFNVNDDAWPYQVAFEGTDINEARATVYVPSQIDGRPISDATFTYDVRLPKRSDYTPVSVTIGGSAAALLSTAFQLNTADIAGKMKTWATAGPKADQVMFYPVNCNTVRTVNRGSTANGYGHWFNASGNVSDYASGYLYSEFTPASLTFNIGQYPGKAKEGNTYTIGQALVYNDGTNKATAYFIFRVHITDGEAGYELVEKTNGIQDIENERLSNGENEKMRERIYDMTGRQIVNRKSSNSNFTSSSVRPKGVYIHNGKKHISSIP
ncbi:MAG: DUF4859 domain-containing protein [Bacteroidaceae bacterium]|nr:DUF4859 domain-containing protein [Bacteroidaceae bacterium]